MGRHWVFLTFLRFLLIHVAAYIPAHPTNSSSEATDVSKLHLRWFSNGSYMQNISYQLAGADSRGISKGALVHFSEAIANSTTPPTTTPWIAMIPCDFNATNASEVDDVFTLARDRGARAALLYSLYSSACVINSEYADPRTYDQVFDIFSTQTLTSARLIEYQFGQFGHMNETLYGVYDSKRLNNSAGVINTTIQQGTPAAPGYLFAILQAYNATDQIDDPSTSGGSGTSSSSPPASSSPNTALAMIILYAITGCVSALFCVVIVSGAIRAIRNPERYGPRSGAGGPGQSRARGLTRAILDTFPVVKFGESGGGPAGNPSVSPPVKDIENPSEGRSSNSAVELREWEVLNTDANTPSSPRAHAPVVGAIWRGSENQGISEVLAGSGEQSDVGGPTPRRTIQIVTDTDCRLGDVGEGTSQRPPPANRNRDDVVPAAIGRETCPICIMDFEEGDDLRLLPCEGKHRFHQNCVDPWLLELSSSCPICRQDFLALENILSGSEHGHFDQWEDQDDEYDHRRSRAPDFANGGNRFSRYLRFAKRRHHRERGEEPDPTDPYIPTVSETQTNPARSGIP